MNSHLRSAVERALSDHLGERITLANVQEVQGGCINDAARITTSSGRHFFLKSNPSAPEGMFEAEAGGLDAILKTNSIRAPRPIVNSIAPERSECPPFLLLEFIDAAAPRADFAEQLGRNLAALHRAQAEQFGFESDNYIGSSPQSNEWNPSWPGFFAHSRLGFQLKLLEQKGRATSELQSGLAKLLEKLDGLIGGHHPIPSLLHGDLWSGNVITDELGGPVVIDPAVYYGDREADLAMTELFGRFDPKFYAAYQEAFPLEDGYEDRRAIYNLYHLMNHLLIFGLSYMGGVMQVLRRYT